MNARAEVLGKFVLLTFADHVKARSTFDSFGGTNPTGHGLVIAAGMVELTDLCERSRKLNALDDPSVCVRCRFEAELPLLLAAIAQRNYCPCASSTFLLQ